MPRRRRAIVRGQRQRATSRPAGPWQRSCVASGMLHRRNRQTADKRQRGKKKGSATVAADPLHDWWRTRDSNPGLAPSTFGQPLSPSAVSRCRSSIATPAPVRPAVAAEVTARKSRSRRSVSPSACLPISPPTRRRGRGSWFWRAKVRPLGRPICAMKAAQGHCAALVGKKRLTGRRHDVDVIEFRRYRFASREYLAEDRDGSTGPCERNPGRPIPTDARMRSVSKAHRPASRIPPAPSST